MATGFKTPQELKNSTSSSDQLRRERITGVVVLVVFAALMALLIWLASLGGVGGSVDYDMWMMP